MLIPNANPLLSASSAVGDESEALQADVMRFVAILGLCLMVIFALVQSLPTAGESREDARERAEERSALLAQVRRLQDELAEQASQLAEQADVPATDQASLQTLADALRAEREQRARSRADAEQVRATLDRQLDELRASAAGQAGELARSETARRAAERRAEQLQARNDALQAQLAVQPEPAPPDPAPAPNTAQEAAPEIEPDAAPPASDVSSVAEPPEQGFRLRFASNAALYALVSQGAIQVFARDGERGWRLSEDGQRLVPSELPGQFNEMAASTIPAQLRARLDTVASRSTEVTWGVALSSSMAESIAARISGAEGGTLLIRETGEVDLR